MPIMDQVVEDTRFEV